MSGGPRRQGPRARARQTVIQRRRRQREERKRGGHSFFFWGPLALLALALIAIGGVAAAAWGVYSSFADDLVEPEAILDTQRALGTSKVFDSGGAEEGTLLFQFADPLSGLRNPVRIEDVSSHLINATVATEDGSFFENSGINTRGLARAAWENLGFGMGDFFGGSGGSSITQQLVKNVLIPLEERSGRTIERAEAKLKESILAIELTQQYSKLQILEWYLNTIFYGNLSYGIGAAAERYFGRPAADLALHEAALLAGLPQAPALLDPFEFPEAAKARQGLVLDLMERNGYITAEEAAAAKQQPLNFASREFSIEAPHFVTYVAEEVERLCGRGRIPLPEEVQGCEDLLTEGGATDHDDAGPGPAAAGGGDPAAGPGDVRGADGGAQRGPGGAGPGDGRDPGDGGEPGLLPGGHRRAGEPGDGRELAGVVDQADHVRGRVRAGSAGVEPGHDRVGRAAGVPGDRRGRCSPRRTSTRCSEAR